MKRFNRIEVFHAKEETMARFIDNFVWFSAGVCALAAISAARVFCSREKTKSAVGVAEASVTESFQFYLLTRHCCSDFFNFQRCELTCQHNPLESGPHGLKNSIEVVNCHLC